MRGKIVLSIHSTTMGPTAMHIRILLIRIFQIKKYHNINKLIIIKVTFKYFQLFKLVDKTFSNKDFFLTGRSNGLKLFCKLMRMLL